MTDLKRHSKGYWRSIYIFGLYEGKDQIEIKNKLVPELEQRKLVYSYCFYGKTGDEAEHITFRINFKTKQQMEDILKFAKKQKWKFEDHNYDEEMTTKMAYVLGTKMAHEIQATLKGEGDVALSSNFIRLMLHGMFNDLRYGYKGEFELYFFLVKAMLSSVYGFKISGD